MNDSDAITPVKDVWLRPRRVFRELATRPIGSTDLALASLQGIADYVTLARVYAGAPHPTPAQVLMGSLLLGPLVGLIDAALWAFLYSNIGKRLGAKAGFVPVFHVSTYGTVPRVATLIIWAVIALIVGEAAFVAVPPAGTDTFVVVLLRAQTIASYLAMVWAWLLQVMGLSEVFDFKLAKAFGLWGAGQLIIIVLGFIALNLTGQMS